MVPEFPGFQSRALAGVGRMYELHGDVRCIAYWIADPETLRSAGVTEGFILYAFLDRRTLSTWNCALKPDQLHAALEHARLAFDADAHRPVPLAPGGEPAMITPQLNRIIERELRPRLIEFELDR
jgi:hypothetical protein